MKLKLTEITPYKKNAKAHPEKQIQQIANSIKEFGFNQPIVVDKKRIIIVGHGRYEAAKLLKLTEVPVLELNLSEEQTKAYRLADNKLNESDWDIDIVIDELKDLDLKMIDLTGFDQDDLDLEKDYSRSNIEINIEKFGETLKHKCPKCGFKFDKHV